jgi:hypothetical protein
VSAQARMIKFKFATMRAQVFSASRKDCRPTIFQLMFWIFSAIAWLTLVFICCQYLPYSPLYRFDVKYADQRERFRLGKAETYLHELMNVTSQQLFNNARFGVKLCIAFQSIYRRSEYITQSVAFLLYRLLHEGILPNGRTVDVFVYNGNVPPEGHLQLTQNSVISRLLRVETPHTNFTKDLNSSDYHSIWIAREKLQYAEILDLVHKNACPWAVILEDDAIVSNRFFGRISNIIAKYSQDEQLSYIKLFFPEQWNGWENLPADYAILLSLAVVSSCFLALISLVVKSRLSDKAPQFRCAHVCRGSAQLMLRHAVSYVPLMIATFWMLGKQSIISPYGPGESPAPSSIFTVGQLYPRHFMSAAAAYLRQDDSDLPLDMALSELAGERGLRSYITVPSLVQHVGIYSSNRLKSQGGHLRQSLTFPDSSDELS